MTTATATRQTYRNQLEAEIREWFLCGFFTLPQVRRISRLAKLAGTTVDAAVETFRATLP